MSANLIPGQSVSHIFEAKEREVRPGWRVAANSRLAFAVEIVEPLRDDAIDVPSTDGFEASGLPNPVLRLLMSAGVLLRCRRDANWFALIGGIVEPGTALTRAVERGRGFFVIGAGRSEADPVIVARGGEFVCFLNDAPQSFFYKNNHGRVKLTLSVLA